VSTISYKPLAVISPNLQLRCSWGKDELIRFGVEKIKVMMTPHIVINQSVAVEDHLVTVQTFLVNLG